MIEIGTDSDTSTSPNRKHSSSATPAGRRESAASRPPRSSPASSPDTDAIAARLYAHGPLSFWDYAAAGCYVPTRMATPPPAPPSRRHGRVAGEDVLGGYLRHASAVMAERPDIVDDGVTRIPPEFEALRWFHLSPVCLSESAETSLPLS